MPVTPQVPRVLIIAAGRGLRLDSHTRTVPKTLISFGSATILGCILRGIALSGIREVIIVTGYKNDILSSQVGDGSDIGIAVSYVHNSDWRMKNGVSVLAAREVLSGDENFLLMMSDHLCSKEMVEAMIHAPLAPEEIALAVDKKLETIFDMDDATKVRTKDGFIVEIGKQLSHYDGVDCGLFKCTPTLFDELEAVRSSAGDCSLTDGCERFALSGKMKAVSIGESKWIDIDTPEALAEARILFPEF